MHRLIKDFVETNPAHPLTMVLDKAGLNMQVRQSKENHKLQLVKAVQSVVQLYLGGYSDETKGDIVGEMLFNHQVLPPGAVNHMAVKISRSVNSFIFTTVNILKCIDLQHSLDDRGANEYASIHNPARNMSQLPKRHGLTTVRQCANRYVTMTLQPQNYAKSRFGEMVKLDPERSLRYSVEAFGLKEKAVNEGIEIAVTGDGAAIATSGRDPSQCAVGYKFIDIDVTDPITNQPCYYTDETDDDGITCRMYKNLQSINTCLPTGMCLHKETQELLTHLEGFGSFFNAVKRFEKEGINERQGEPSFKPIKLVCTGDTSVNETRHLFRFRYCPYFSWNLI
jgi:hypothetical protein